ncbi:MAG: outer membrane protein assembly factor BamA [Deltaproteobacteria bacterium]|nr:outer membrane protein assembly factor BamA [Deltaproteobacteria bacterium]
MKYKGLFLTGVFYPLTLVSLLMGHFSLLQAQQPVIIKEIKIQGNARVEVDGIKLHTKVRAGEPLDPGVVDQDVKSIYRMGFFDDVKAELSPEGVLTYTVKEKPYVREVKIQGSKELAKEKIQTAFGISPRTILDRDKISEGVEKVKKLYAEQGYVNAQVDYALSVMENNQAEIQLSITEGARVLIQKISFKGNKAFSESELKGLMSTKEQWFLSFITNRGVLEQDTLTNDVATLSAHYYDHGYINHKIDEPVVVKRRDGIEVVIRVHEGEQFRVGKVEIGGDLIEDGGTLLKKIEMTTGQIFRGSRLRNDITMLNDLYSDKGFAFAQIEPVTKVNQEDKNVDVALVIARGPPVFFNHVLVAGNTKTRDRVIRREVLAGEQTLFSSNKIRQSRDALQRTGYFEDVQLTTKKTEQPDAVDLLVDVREGPTGAFSVGAGYSSGDQFVFTSSITEKNLFGLGQAISANFALGSSRQDFVLSFTEPYLYNTPLSFGFDAFNTQREFNDFDDRKTGFGLRTSYPLRRLGLPFLRTPVPNPASDTPDWAYHPFIAYTRVGAGYDLVREKVSDINESAPDSIKNSEGSSWTSAMTPNFTYDSRDHFFNPTRGTSSGLAFKFAGLGGDNKFIKSDLRTRWHYSVLKDPNWGGTYTIALGGAFGYGVPLGAQPSGDKHLPLFERYFPGGINSIRGFKDRSLGPRDGDDVVGGDKQIVFNAELLFPLLEKYGVRGVTFFDMGQAFGDVGQNSDELKNISFSEFRMSAGLGVRWLSPFGPLRVELGFPIKKKSGDDTSVLGFSVGNLP